MRKIYLALILFLVSYNAHSASSPEFHIEAVKLSSTGVAIKIQESWGGNASAPHDGQYVFFIDYANPNSKSMISLVLTALASGKPVSFVFGSGEITVDGKNYILVQ